MCAAWRAVVTVSAKSGRSDDQGFAAACDPGREGLAGSSLFLRNPDIADPPLWGGSMADLTIHELSGLSREDLIRALRKEVQGMRGVEPEGTVACETNKGRAPLGKRAAGKGTTPAHRFSVRDLFLKVFACFSAQSLPHE